MVKCPTTIRLCLLLGAALALASCRQTDGNAPAPQASEAAGPQAKPGLSVSSGVLILPAVAGRPGAAYFMLSNGGGGAAELAGIYIDGAKRAEMHETSGGSMARLDKLTVAPDETVQFARGGKHVMAFDLDEDLKPGGFTEMTLSFSDGDKLSAPLKIEAMGGAGQMDDMEHMDHAAGH